MAGISPVSSVTANATLTRTDLAAAHASLSPLQMGEALRLADSLERPRTSDAVWRPETSPVELTQVQDGPRNAGRINLLDHEGRGVPPAHTIALHVGKSRAFLMNMMQPIDLGAGAAYRTRHSTFSSLEAANALVSSTLATGQEVSPGVFYREFSSPTGMAAVRRDMIPVLRPQGRVSFETAYGVLVVTRPDATMPGGFRIQSAYPTIPFSGLGS